MALQSPVDYLRKKEDSILPDDDTSNAEFLDPQDLASQDENTYGSQGGGTGGDSFDDDGMEAGRTVAAKSAFAGPAPKSTAPPSPALDPGAYNAASQKVADITGQRPGAPKPKWWQRLAAGAVGGLAGFSNAEGKAGPQINPAAAEDALLGGPQSRRQLSDWQRQVDAATAQQSAAKEQLGAAEAIQKSNTDKQLREVQMETAKARLAQAQRAQTQKTPDYKARFDEAKRAGASDDQAHIYASGGHLAPPKPTRLSTAWAIPPGATDPVPVLIDPVNPGKILSVSGQEMPEGTKMVNPGVVGQERRAQMYGEFGNYFRAMKGQGLSDQDASRKAGEMVSKKYNVQLSSTEMNIALGQQRGAINADLSGVGIGGGGSSAPPTGAPTPRGAAPAVPQQQPSAPGAQQSPAAPAAPPTSPLAFNDQELGYVNQFLGQLMGTMPGGRGAAGAVGAKKGMMLISQRTGLDPMTLQSYFVSNKAAGKQLAETIQRSGAIQRLNNTIDAHGKVLEDVAKTVQDSGSPFLNKPIREWSRAAAGSPEYKRFQIAINALQREYAYLTAGGAQSRAMLPVNTTSTMEHMLSGDSTLAEVGAAVDQIRIEARKEQEAMKKTQGDIIGEMQGNPVGRAVNPNGPPAAGATRAGPKVGDVQPHNGDDYRFDGTQWVKQKPNAR